MALLNSHYSNVHEFVRHVVSLDSIMNIVEGCLLHPFDLGKCDGVRREHSCLGVCKFIFDLDTHIVVHVLGNMGRAEYSDASVCFAYLYRTEDTSWWEEEYITTRQLLDILKEVVVVGKTTDEAVNEVVYQH